MKHINPEQQTAAEFINTQINLADWEMDRAADEADAAQKLSLGGGIISGVFLLASYYEKGKTGTSEVSTTFAGLAAVSGLSGLVGSLRARFKSHKASRFEERAKTLEAHKEFAASEIEFQEEEGYIRAASENKDEGRLRPWAVEVNPTGSGKDDEEEAKDQALKIEASPAKDTEDEEDPSLDERIASAEHTLARDKVLTVACGIGAGLNAIPAVSNFMEFQQGQSGSELTLAVNGVAIVGLGVGALSFAAEIEDHKDELSRYRTRQITDRYREIREREAVVSVAVAA